MHTDARAARRDHGGDLLQREHGHALEERRDLRMLVDLALTHIEEFRAARNEQRQHPALFVVWVLAVQIFPVVFNDAEPCHFGEELFQRLALHFRQLHQLLGGLWLANAHLERHIRHFVGHHTGKAPVFGVVRRGLEADAVGDHAAEPEDVLARLVRTRDLEIQLALVEREVRGLAAVDVAHGPLSFSPRRTA